MDESVSGQEDGWMDEWMGGWMDGWMGGWMVGWMGWVEVCVCLCRGWAGWRVCV